MNNFDLSKISDISTISQISFSQFMGRIDPALASSKFNRQSSFIQNSSKDLVNADQYINPLTKVTKSNSSKGSVNSDEYINPLTKVTKSFIACQNSISEYAKAKLIFECVEEVCANKNNALPEETAKKLKGLLQLHEINKIKNCSLTSKHMSQDLDLLGIIDYPDYKLTYEEKLNIKACVEALIREKIHGFLVRYQKLGGNLIELQRSNGLEASNKLQENVDLELLEWKDKFEDICAQYKNYLLYCADMMNEWAKIKNVDVNEVYYERAQSLLLQSKTVEVQAKLTRLTCLTKMYTETPTTIEAYKILSKIIDDKLFEVNNEIKKKENLRKLYLGLQNTEYDNILKTYLHLSNAVKKKKQVLQMLEKDK